MMSENWVNEGENFKNPQLKSNHNDKLMSIYGGVALTGGVVETLGPDEFCIDLKLKPGIDE